MEKREKGLCSIFFSENTGENGKKSLFLDIVNIIRSFLLLPDYFKLIEAITRKKYRIQIENDYLFCRNCYHIPRTEWAISKYRFCMGCNYQHCEMCIGSYKFRVDIRKIHKHDIRKIYKHDILCVSKRNMEQKKRGKVTTFIELCKNCKMEIENIKPNVTYEIIVDYFIKNKEKSVEYKKTLDDYLFKNSQNIKIESKKLKLEK